MTTYDNGYSRFVAWAKIVLPLMALGLLSTMFLFSQSTDPTLSIPYADVDVEQIARDQTVKSPTYQGISDDGSAISVNAQTARPSLSNPNQYSAETMVARLDLKDGSVVDIVSKTGEIDNDTSVIVLEGDVQIKTSTGYQMNTETLTTSLNQSWIRSAGEVIATGPLGNLVAGQMEITQSDNEEYVLVFINGVKLIYKP